MELLKICYNCCRQRTGTVTVGLLDLTAHIFLLRYAVFSPENSLVPIFNNNELLICFYSTSMITIVLLLAGAFRGNIWLIIPWMGFKMTAIISLPVHVIYILIYYSKDYLFFSLVKIWAGLIVLAIAILITFVLVVARYFNELTKGKAQAEAQTDSQGISLTIIKTENSTEDQGISLSKTKAQSEIEDQEILLTEIVEGDKKNVPVNHTFF